MKRQNNNNGFVKLRSYIANEVRQSVFRNSGKVFLISFLKTSQTGNEKKMTEISLSIKVYLR